MTAKVALKGTEQNGSSTVWLTLGQQMESC